MGVPRFFIEILKKYKKTHFSDPSFKFQYYFMDYNAFIYKSISLFFNDVKYDEFKQLSMSKRETTLSTFIVNETIKHVNEISPEKLVYIALDGSAPRSKMKLQRYRRYKSVKKKLFIKKIKKMFDLKENASSLWDSSCLSPGTTMMEKISKGLKIASKTNKFIGKNLSIIISDTLIAGEGEHKILDFIKNMKRVISEKICIYSPDADVIILSWQLEGHIYVMQPIDRTKSEHNELYPSSEVKHIIFSIIEYKKSLKEEFHQFKHIKIDNLTKDLTLLTFLIGNDFVKPIFFLKSTNKYSLTTLINIYKKLLYKYIFTNNAYLVTIKNNIPIINEKFLLDIFKKLSHREDFNMKKYYDNIFKRLNKNYEHKKETYEDYISSFEHDKYFCPSHPYYEEKLISTINYNEPHDIWKKKYYSYFFNLDLYNYEEFISYKKLICKMYLKSLSYCLQYYLTGLPSWNWYYPFRISPMPSDIVYFMNDFMKNEKRKQNYIKKNYRRRKNYSAETCCNFIFKKGNSYYPIEQLAMILPPQNAYMLPKSIRCLIENPKSILFSYYPIDFELDKLAGEKFIYSYPLLPSISDHIIRPILQNTFKKFTNSEKSRNTQRNTIFIQQNKN